MWLIVWLVPQLIVECCGVYTGSLAGLAKVTNAFRNSGVKVAPYEIKSDPVGMDILGDMGFCNAILLALQSAPGSFCMLAPVCSTWVFLNRGTSRRCRARPLGDTRVVSVRQANIMVSRVCLLLYIFISKGVWWLLEQPVSSLLEYHPRMQEMATLHPMFRAFTWLGAYGPGSPKGSILYSCHEFIGELYRPITRDTQFKDTNNLARKYVDSSGKARVHGLAGLKGSQTYPAGFGSALVAMYSTHSDAINAGARALHAEVPALFQVAVAGSDCWLDADLAGVFRFLQGSGV